MAAVAGQAFGKVLVVGGYLVLDGFPGLVLATDSYFKATCSPLEEMVPFSVQVLSPRFSDGKWTFKAFMDNKQSLVSIESDGYWLLGVLTYRTVANPYIETALVACLNASLGIVGGPAMKEILEKGLQIHIESSDDFYSGPSQGIPLSSVKKTGLGSSAALVSCLVSSLMHYIIKDDVSYTQIHAVSQYAHCKAQGKIGSGFDVSAALFGSQVYKRFSSNVLDRFLNIKHPISARDMLEMMDADWDQKIRPFRLPKRLKLILADISYGSSTPKMVSQVMSWRLNDRDNSERIWKDLNRSNVAVIDLLEQLISLENGDAFNVAIDALSRTPAEEWKGVCKVSHILTSTYKEFKVINSFMQRTFDCY